MPTNSALKDEKNELEIYVYFLTLFPLVIVLAFANLNHLMAASHTESGGMGLYSLGEAWLGLNNNATAYWLLRSFIECFLIAIVALFGALVSCLKGFRRMPLRWLFSTIAALLISLCGYFLLSQLSGLFAQFFQL